MSVSIASRDWHLAVWAALVLAIIVLACTRTQQQTVHMTTHACMSLAALHGDPKLQAACQAAHDISEHVVALSSATCALPESPDGGTDGR